MHPQDDHPRPTHRRLGEPCGRTTASHAEQPHPVEVYEFLDRAGGLYRFATVGMSVQKLSDGRTAAWELSFCAPYDLGDAPRDDVIRLVLDVMACSLRDDPARLGGPLRSWQNRPPGPHEPVACPTP